MVDIPSTYGALLLGGLVAAGLSGIVTIQAFVYIKLYPSDIIQTKAIVALVCVLDSCHTGFVCSSLWDYLIMYFGDSSRIDVIPWSLALTVAFTAILTSVVHCFFAHRIYKLSKHNLWITFPIVILAFLRLCAACVTTAEMIRLGTFSAFVQQFRWVFTLGLGLSSTVDIVISVFLCYSLQTSRSASSSMDHVINLIILYTVENGALTCAATIISMICWLIMPSNRVFLGIHFFICKVYANSLLATLNTRKTLQRKRTRISKSSGLSRPALLTNTSGRFSHLSSPTEKTMRPTTVEINVEQTVEYEVEVDGQVVTLTEAV